MKDLTNLREVSETVLHGLTADASLKNRILQQAASDAENRKPSAFRLVPAFCGVIAALLIAAVALNGLQPVSPAGSVEIKVFAAGDQETVPPGDDAAVDSRSILSGADPSDVYSVELSGSGMVSDRKECAALAGILIRESVPAEPVDPCSADVLTITTVSGQKIMYEAAAPYLIGEKCWSCPGFFTLLEQLLKEQGPL